MRGRRLTEEEKSAVLSFQAYEKGITWGRGPNGPWWLKYGICRGLVVDVGPIEGDAGGKSLEVLARALDRCRVAFPQVLP